MSTPLEPYDADELINIGAVEQVSTQDAMAMTRRLANEVGLFTGTSTGGHVIAALKITRELGPDCTVVTIMADTGMKYLSTEQYRQVY